MTGNKDLLCNIEPMNKTFVTPTGEIEAIEMGDVRTDNIILSNVLYCPGLRYDLPSLSLIA